MRVQKRDIIATCLVAAAVVVYLFWVVGSGLPGLGSIRATGTVVLVLGFAASASAVVPGFVQLLHGNRAYLAVTSLIGLAALVGGVLTLIAESAAGLAVVMGAMVVLWLIATTHHSLLAAAVAPAADVQARQGPRHPAAA